MFSSKPTTTTEALGPFSKVRIDLISVKNDQKKKVRELEARIEELTKERDAASKEAAEATVALQKLDEVFPTAEKK